MTKSTRTRRDPGRSYKDENKERVQKEARIALKRFLDEGMDAEPRYVAAVKAWLPDITKEELSRRREGEAVGRRTVSLNRFSASRNSLSVMVFAALSIILSKSSSNSFAADLRLTAGAAT
jgi:hypothetical protein